MIFLIYFISSALALESCPLKSQDFWSHYADEWGHEEKKVEELKQAAITMGSEKGLWLYLPRTCTKLGCDVSFLYQLPQKDCWKPLVSIQGKIRTLKKGDWSRFKNTYLRSSVNMKKTNQQVWVFDSKEKMFHQEIKK